MAGEAFFYWEKIVGKVRAPCKEISECNGVVMGIVTGEVGETPLNLPFKSIPQTHEACRGLRKGRNTVRGKVLNSVLIVLV